MKKNILVIKHGALGDIILASAAMRAIRNYHKNDNVICLTTKAFEGLLKYSPWFDKVYIDSKPKWSDFKNWKNLINFFNKYKFSKIYDLQTSYRSNLYFFFFFIYKKVDWSGIAIGCKYRHSNKNRKMMHTVDRQREQLKVAGINYNFIPDWKWLTNNYNNQTIIPENKFAIIVSGSAKHRENKRWAKKKYANLIDHLSTLGIQSILIGGPEEYNNINDIIHKVNDNVKFKPFNYSGKTSYKDIVLLGKFAIFAIGNDTGPMHLLASCGLTSIVLFGAASNPDLCAPIGKDVHVIHKKIIDDIKLKDVSEILKNIVIY